jgi:hypothetical protein
MENTKECIKYHQTLAINAFSINKRYKRDGRETKCRSCFAKEKSLPGARISQKISRDNWKAENPNYVKQYAIDNKDQLAEYHKDWYQTKKTDPNFTETIRKRTADQRLKPEVQERERNYKLENAIQVKMYPLAKKDQDNGLDFDITKEDVLAIVAKQNGLNLYTNSPIKWTINVSGNGDHSSSSIDRIDNTKGHVKGNIQIVELWINRLKLHFDNEFPTLLRFIKHSRTLYDIGQCLCIDYPTDAKSNTIYYEGSLPWTLKDFPREMSELYLNSIKQDIKRVSYNLIHNSKSSQTERNNTDEIGFDLDYLYQLLEEQDYKCAITGIVMNLRSNNPYKVSIDRIDSNKPYSKENIHLICYAINSAKSTMNYFDFIEKICDLQMALLTN